MIEVGSGIDERSHASRDAGQVAVDSAVTRISMGLLLPAASPRLGMNDDHVRALAELDSFPPVIVNRQSMRIVDGMHRFHAAKLRGQDEIEARWHHGDEHAAFLLSVSANIGHGLPLSFVERTSAAKRLLRAKPDWSDRMIASCTGLAAKTVEKLRAEDYGAENGAGVRVGRDGRVRPLSTAHTRLRARDLILEQPKASLREIAAQVGLAPSTVKDVRDRIRSGLDPVPDRERTRSGVPLSVPDGSNADASQPRSDALVRVVRGTTREPEPPDRTTNRLQLLRRDPSMRFNEVGRNLLRSLELDLTSADQRSRIIDAVPPHCIETLASLAREVARGWDALGKEFDDRSRNVWQEHARG